MGKTKEVELTHRQFLSKPENFKIAVEVFDHFEEVRTFLQEKYWSDVRYFVENHKSRGQFGKWKVTDDGAVPTGKHYGIAFDPSKPGSSLYCGAYLQQGEPGHRFPISLGIVWRADDPPEKEPELPELRSLRKYLTEELKLTRPTHKWWIARGQPAYELHSFEVLTQLANNKTIQQLQADEFVQLFLETRKMVERLNAKIARSA